MKLKKGLFNWLDRHTKKWSVGEGTLPWATYSIHDKSFKISNIRTCLTSAIFWIFKIAWIIRIKKYYLEVQNFLFSFIQNFFIRFIVLFKLSIIEMLNWILKSIDFQRYSHITIKIVCLTESWAKRVVSHEITN